MKRLKQLLSQPIFVIVFIICATTEVYARSLDFGALSFSDEVPKPSASKYRYEQQMEYGAYYLKQGLYEEAKDEFWKAIELFPDNPDAYVNLAIVHIHQKEYDNALRILSKAEELAPPGYHQREILLYNFGLAYFCNGNYEEAIEYLKKALEVYPDFGEALFYLGLAYDKNGDVASAFINIFEARYLFEKKGLTDLQTQSEGLLRDLSLRPAIDNVALAQRFYERGKVVLEQEDDLEKTAYLFQESIFLNPQYTDVYYQLALLCSRKDAPHNAIAYLMRIIEVDPANVNAYVSLGYVYRDLRKYDQALRYLGKALELEPENAIIFYDIAMTNFQAQSYHAAEKYFMQSRKIALADKNLFLIEKIDAALKQMKQRQAVSERPLRLPKTVMPKESKQDIIAHYDIGGNQGSFNQGYFTSRPEPQTEPSRKKPSPLISYEQYRY